MVDLIIEEDVGPGTRVWEDKIEVPLYDLIWLFLEFDRRRMHVKYASST